MPWDVNVENVAKGATALIEAGIPSSFLLAYDEPWLLAHQVKELLWMVTGNEHGFDWYFFYVDPNNPKAIMYCSNP